MLDKIIEKEHIEILMQPVVSPNKDFTAGVEALARGIDPDSGEVISPKVLYDWAKSEELVIQLEKVVIKKIFEAYRPLYLEDSSLLLFVNLSDEFLTYAKHSFYIESLVDQLELPNSNIVFDLHVLDDAYLEVAKEFVVNYKEKGFFICIDDIGKNYYNIDKILYLGPDLVKVNIIKMKLMKDTVYRDLLFSNTTQIANTMGIIVVAKGVETERDLSLAMKYGVQFIQGFYISEPIKANLFDITRAIDTFQSTTKHEESKGVGVESSRRITAKIIRMMNAMKNQMEQVALNEIQVLIAAFLEVYGCIENMWILNDQGWVIDDTIINFNMYSVNKSPIYQIYKSGADFSTKEHYTMLQSDFMDSWVTKPYKSILTNNVCLGGSIEVKIEGQSFILCMNVNYESIRSQITE